jgi:broad specificity phosphatase PhoE
VSATGLQPRLVIVRHGETEWSTAWRHTGRTDIPLTDHGRQAAAALRSVLAGRPFALVLTSPLQRARETAALAGFPDAEVCDDLLEWDYGEDEGRTSDEIREERPGWSIWSDGPKDGEPIAHVAVRAERVIDRALGAGGDVLAFAHGHVLRILTARWLALHPEIGKRFLLGTAAPSTLGWEHDYRVIETWSCRAS